MADSLLHQTLQQTYQGKKILILGFGREGKSTYEVLRKCFTVQDLFIANEKPLDLSSYNDEHLIFDDKYLDNLLSYDVIFKTPGVSIWEPQLQEFLASPGTLTSQLNEFLRIYRDKTIGVTGTKGKSTTSALIHHILKTAGHDVVLAGNIGKPVFDTMDGISDETTIVVEMSSYQLETVFFSPHVAVLLNLYAEHLNYHQTLGNYQEAKANITKFQSPTDFFIYNTEIPEIVQIASKSSAQKRPFTPAESYDSSLSLSKIAQQHNLPAALEVAKVFHVFGQDIEAAIHSFVPLPHRLQEIGVYKGLTFIDDTLATIPEATCAALDHFASVSVLLLGGFDRGIDYSGVVAKVIEKKIPTVIFFKPSGEKMYTLMKEKYTAEQLPQVFFVESMKEAVELSYQHGQPNSIVLLSPSSPSYGQFKDYEDKSAQFVSYVQELGR